MTMLLHRSARGARSGYAGVTQDRRTPGQERKWRARISHPPGKILLLGVYPTARAAARRVWEALRTIRRGPGRHMQRVCCRWGHVWLSPGDVDTWITKGGYRKRTCRRCRRERVRAVRLAARRQRASS